MTGRPAVNSPLCWQSRLLLSMSQPLRSAREPDKSPVRHSTISYVAELLAELVREKTQTLAFVSSRRTAEMVALAAQQRLNDIAPELVGHVAAYRGGYLREERRSLENQLRDGELLGVATTNALELGVNITGVDAVLLAGFPGTLASLWQQAGRAGRLGGSALAVLAARSDPLDSYLVHHPHAIFDRPIETTVIDPANPHVLRPHLACAASELRINDAELHRWGPRAARDALAELKTEGLLRERSTGWHWTSARRPRVDLRGGSGEPVAVVEASTGRLLGTVNAGTAHQTVHPGATYLHQGDTFLVEELDLDDDVALVRRDDPPWSTRARQITDLRIVEVEQHTEADEVRLCYGDVEVTSRVVSYQQRRLITHELLNEIPLSLPERRFRTKAVWWTVADSALPGAGLSAGFAGAAGDIRAPSDDAMPIVIYRLPGAVHAAEHAAIGLLPLVATCDRWDVGGLSSACHADTGQATCLRVRRCSRRGRFR